MALYKRIRDLREDSDKKQSEIASFLQTTPQYYGKYESGEREIPLSRAIKLADFYGVSLDYLAGRSNDYSFTKEEFSYDEIALLKYYKMLTERNKGKLEMFLENLIKSQNLKN